MKKLLLLLIVFIVGSAGAFAFDILSYPPPVNGGNILVDIGIGLISAKDGDITIPPLRVSAEYALTAGVPISVGGLIAIHGSEYKNWGSKLSWLYFTFGGRANWHWGLDVAWLDLYSGIFLGYQVVSYDGPSYYEDHFDYGGFTPGIQVGAHFYFTDKLGAFVEFGHPYWASIGLALKF
jgi:tetrahydromethanopterin S-methyltransferase subunit E